MCIRDRAPLTKLARHDSVDTSTERLAAVVQENARVVIKLDHTTISALGLLFRTHDNRAAHIATADLEVVSGAWNRVGGNRLGLLHNHYDFVACQLARTDATKAH